MICSSLPHRVRPRGIQRSSRSTRMDKDETSYQLVFYFSFMTPNDKKIIVQGHEIWFVKDTDFISLTDIAKRFWDLGLIDRWLRNKNTVEFLGVWERLNNPNFNSPEFEGIMIQAWLNRFSLSVMVSISFLFSHSRQHGPRNHSTLEFHSLHRSERWCEASCPRPRRDDLAYTRPNGWIVR